MNLSFPPCQNVSLAGRRAPRIVSLFSGYGGLEMGIQSVVGGEVIAHVEFDDAPSRILAHHYPGVPNLGDITAVDWTAFLADHPELGDLFGSYRPGVIVCGGFPCQDLSLAGRRAGMRPGTRSGLWADFLKAIDALRPELAVIENVRGLLSGCAESEADSDRGPCPRCADPKSGVGHAPNVRALGRVLIDLASIGYDARWVGLRAADAGAPHARFRVFVLAYPGGEALRLGAGLRASEPAGRGRRRPDDDGVPASAADTHGRDERRGEARHMARATGPVEGERDQRERDGNAAADRGATPADTSRARLGEQSRGASAEEARTHGGDLAAGDRGPRPAQNWGPYRPAIERWERRLGRRAPNPTRPDGKNGANRLNPAFVEWMMGLPEGWVAAPEIGLTRPQQLKALGNGVVQQQAALATELLLAPEAVAA